MELSCTAMAVGSLVLGVVAGGIITWKVTDRYSRFQVEQARRSQEASLLKLVDALINLNLIRPEEGAKARRIVGQVSARESRVVAGPWWLRVLVPRETIGDLLEGETQQNAAQSHPPAKGS